MPYSVEENVEDEAHKALTVSFSSPICSDEWVLSLLTRASDWKKKCWSLQTQMNSMRCPVLSFYFVADLLSVKTFRKSFPTSSWCKICLSFSSSNFISGAIWNRLTSPRLMFTDHSGSWLWALISLILPPLKTTLNGSCKVFNILSSIAVCSCCLGSLSFPVTWWNEMFSN